jgi:hypothetical protein
MEHDLHLLKTQIRKKLSKSEAERDSEAVQISEEVFAIHVCVCVAGLWVCCGFNVFFFTYAESGDDKSTQHRHQCQPLKFAHRQRDSDLI